MQNRLSEALDGVTSKLIDVTSKKSKNMQAKLQSNPELYTDARLLLNEAFKVWFKFSEDIHEKPHKVAAKVFNSAYHFAKFAAKFDKIDNSEANDFQSEMDHLIKTFFNEFTTVLMEYINSLTEKEAKSESKLTAELKRFKTETKLENQLIMFNDLLNSIFELIEFW